MVVEFSFGNTRFFFDRAGTWIHPVFNLGGKRGRSLGFPWFEPWWGSPEANTLASFATPRFWK